MCVVFVLLSGCNVVIDISCKRKKLADASFFLVSSLVCRLFINHMLYLTLDSRGYIIITLIMQAPYSSYFF
jgi:hypothetical protein